MLKIIHKTDDFAVIFKPSGMLSEGGVTEALTELLRAGDLTSPTPYIVHRLDRTTEGLMVVALTQSAAARLSKIIADGEMHKEYTALVSLPDELPATGEMTDYLFFDRRHDKAFVSDTKRRGAKEARLAYEITETGTYREKPIAVAKIRLFTGRTHQIRVQFGSRKAPLLGDGKYGSRINFKSPSLRSTAVSFPWNGEFLTFEVPSLSLPE